MKSARVEHPSAQCDGKAAYPSFGAAERLLKRHAHRRKPVHPYRCPHCRLWHLGAH